MNSAPFKTPLKRLVSMRRWYRNNPEKAHAASRSYYRRHRDYYLALAAKQRREKGEYRKLKQAEFRANNPNYTREWNARKRFKSAWAKWAAVCAASRGIS